MSSFLFVSKTLNVVCTTRRLLSSSVRFISTAPKPKVSDLVIQTKVPRNTPTQKDQKPTTRLPSLNKDPNVDKYYVYRLLELSTFTEEEIKQSYSRLFTERQNSSLSLGLEGATNLLKNFHSHLDSIQ